MGTYLLLPQNQRLNRKEAVVPVGAAASFLFDKNNTICRKK